MGKAFRAKATLLKNGTYVLQDPVGISVVKPVSGHTKTAEDKDNVEDYLMLSGEIDWERFFEFVVPNMKVNLKVLDVGCGRGRWLNALSMYVSNMVKHRMIGLVVVDVSHTAVKQLANGIATPFKLNACYVSRVQDLCLDQSTYAVIWSMHALYAVPAEDLQAVLGMLRMSLRESGVCVIALATQKSFYLTMPGAYAKAAFVGEEGHSRRMTSAEDVTKALDKLGYPHKQRKLVYEEKIDVRSEANCSTYVVRESMFNSFNADNSDAIEYFDDREEQRRKSDLEIMQIPAVREHVCQFLRGDAYHFLQEVQLIFFGNRNVVENLPEDIGVRV